MTPRVVEALRGALPVELEQRHGGADGVVVDVQVFTEVGKRSFPVEDLEANLTAFLDHVAGLRPPAVKGQFMRKVCVSTSMLTFVLMSPE